LLSGTLLVSLDPFTIGITGSFTGAASFFGSGLGAGLASGFGSDLGAAAGSGLASALGASFGASLGASAGLVGPAVWVSSITAKSFPTRTVAPTLAKNFVILPATGALISTAAFPVSKLAIASSSFTKSPSSTRKFHTLLCLLLRDLTSPSVIDSANTGTLMTAIKVCMSFFTCKCSV
jgi:hypothetical protein